MALCFGPADAVLIAVAGSPAAPALIAPEKVIAATHAYRFPGARAKTGVAGREGLNEAEERFSCFRIRLRKL